LAKPFWFSQMKMVSADVRVSDGRLTDFSRCHGSGKIFKDIIPAYPKVAARITNKRLQGLYAVCLYPRPVPKCHEPILRLHLGETFLVLANEDGVGRCESL
jgi:hypothetical protein